MQACIAGGFEPVILFLLSAGVLGYNNMCNPPSDGMAPHGMDHGTRPDNSHTKAGVQKKKKKKNKNK